MECFPNKEMSDLFHDFVVSIRRNSSTIHDASEWGFDE